MGVVAVGDDALQVRRVPGEVPGPVTAGGVTCPGLLGRAFSSDQIAPVLTFPSDTEHTVIDQVCDNLMPHLI